MKKFKELETGDCFIRASDIQFPFTYKHKKICQKPMLVSLAKNSSLKEKSYFEPILVNTYAVGAFLLIDDNEEVIHIK